MKRLIGTLIVFFLTQAAAVQLCEARPTVGAFYYPWFRNTPPTSFHWDNVKRTPVLGQYDSQEYAVMDQHIQWAKDAGLAFFVMSYWPNEGDEWGIYEMFDRAEAAGLGISILIEPDSTLGQIRASFAAQQISYTQYVQQCANWFIWRYDVINNDYQWFSRPGYLKDPDGRKILSFFNWDGASQTRDIINLVFSLRPDISQTSWLWYFGNDGNDMNVIKSLLSPNKGAWSAYMPLTGGGWSKALSNYNAIAPYSWQKMITVAPSFDNTGNPNPVVIPRDNGQRLQAQLTDIKNMPAALSPGYVVVTSFNEWQEDSIIEPATDQGLLYINIIKNWIDSY
jgi:hypothetical protein